MQHACNVFLTYQQQNPFLKLRILERRNNEEFFSFLLSTTIAFTAFAQEKYFDRNQLPQLDQEIIDSSDYSYEKITVKSDSIIPVQTQKSEGLKDKEKRKAHK